LEYISERQGKLADTPLHQAAERSDDQMVKLLLGFSAKPDIKSALKKDTRHSG
jgi:ankyrin repeat protein